MAWDPRASVGRMLAIFGFLFVAETAPTFTSHVSLQAYREPVSMFTTQPMPAEMPTFSIMKCLRATRVVVGRATGYHAFAQPHGRSLRAVAVAVGQWSSSMVTSLSWRSAIVGLSQFSTPASSSRGRLVWFFGEPWSGVFAGFASVRMHRKRGSHSRFEMDAASWRRRLVKFKVQEKLQVACSSLHRTGVRFGVFQFW